MAMVVAMAMVLGWYHYLPASAVAAQRSDASPNNSPPSLPAESALGSCPSRQPFQLVQSWRQRHSRIQTKERKRLLSRSLRRSESELTTTRRKPSYER